MSRAYSVLTVKSVSDDARVIRGIATTPTPDRVGDIVEPLGVKFSNPLPLLWQHQHDRPVGTVKFNKPTKAGITFEAKFAEVDGPPGLKARIDEAWASVKAGMVKGVSIGFRNIKHAVMETGGYQFLETEVYELSLVTIPANAEATIQTIKSIDKRNRAASGRAVEDQRPGASGKRNHVSKGNPMQDIDAQVAELEERRSEIATEMKSFGDVTDLDDEQTAEFDTLSDQLAEVDTKLGRAKRMQKAMGGAKAVTGTTAAAASASRGRTTVEAKAAAPKLDPGIGLARYVRVKAVQFAASRGAEGFDWASGQPVKTIARKMYCEDSAVYGHFAKAAVAAGTTTNSTWASPLVPDEVGFGDFVEFLRPMTILGQMTGLRRIPFRTRLVSQTTGGEGYWVAEGAAKPLTKFDFSKTTLEPLKVANIVVSTMELLRDSSPAADAIIRDQMAEALRARLDIDFIDPAKAAVPGESPASISNGVTPIPASGTGTADDVRADIKALFGAYIAANNSPAGAVWVMTPATALSLSLLLNPLGQPEFPGINMTGGTLSGLPVITSDYVPTLSGGSYVFLVKQSDIWFADEGGIAVDMSQEATLEMDDAPSGTATVSLWQNNLIGFRAERTVNWAKRRPEAVAVLSAVNWGD